jgi:hypothetical protein
VVLTGGIGTVHTGWNAWRMAVEEKATGFEIPYFTMDSI